MKRDCQWMTLLGILIITVAAGCSQPSSDSASGGKATSAGEAPASHIKEITAKINENVQPEKIKAQIVETSEKVEAGLSKAADAAKETMDDMGDAISQKVEEGKEKMAAMQDSATQGQTDLEARASGVASAADDAAAETSSELESAAADAQAGVQDRVAELVAQAHQLIDEDNFQEAVNVAKNALALDAASEEAKAVMARAQDALAQKAQEATGAISDVVQQ